jgi:hypothetical protein
MAENAKQAWSDVGERFSVWGRQVADRYRAAGGNDQGEAEASQRELERAAKELIDGLSRGFTAVSDTLRDEQARKDLGDAVSAIGDAITATVDEATTGLRSGSGTGKAPPADETTPDNAPSADETTSDRPSTDEPPKGDSS